MPFIYMVCSEYHDRYTDECTVVADSTSEVFELIDKYLEYNMLGYGCVRDLHGPVHPDAVNTLTLYQADQFEEELCHDGPMGTHQYIPPKIGDLL